MFYVLGSAAVYDIKYTPVYDSGRVHRRVSLEYLTPCSPFEDVIPEGIKRCRSSVAVLPPSPPKIDDRLPIEKLKDALITGSRRGKKKGWHRRTLGWSTGSQLNGKETRQFTIELLLLEQHLKEATAVESKNKNLKRLKKMVILSR